MLQLIAGLIQFLHLESILFLSVYDLTITMVTAPSGVPSLVSSLLKLHTHFPLFQTVDNSTLT